MNEKIKKQVILNIPYLFIALFMTKVVWGFRLAYGKDLSEKLLNIGGGFALAFDSYFPSFHPTDLLLGITIGAILRLVVYVRGKNAKKYRHGKEYGSARFGTAKDIEPFVDPVFENNVILTKTESLMMSSRPKNPKDARNKNVLIVGKYTKWAKSWNKTLLKLVVSFLISKTKKLNLKEILIWNFLIKQLRFYKHSLWHLVQVLAFGALSTS